MDMKKELLKVISILKEVEEEHQKDCERVSILDKKVVDLQHLIEGGLNLPKKNPQDIYKELEAVLRERRLIKTELQMYGALQRDECDLNTLEGLEALSVALDKLPKKYHNRIYSKNFKEIGE